MLAGLVATRKSGVRRELLKSGVPYLVRINAHLAQRDYLNRSFPGLDVPNSTMQGRNALWSLILKVQAALHCHLL